MQPCFVKGGILCYRVSVRWLQGLAHDFPISQLGLVCLSPIRTDEEGRSGLVCGLCGAPGSSKPAPFLFGTSTSLPHCNCCLISFRYGLSNKPWSLLKLNHASVLPYCLVTLGHDRVWLAISCLKISLFLCFSDITIGRVQDRSVYQPT